MASRTASLALRAAQRTAARAVVRPATQASSGLRRFGTTRVPVCGLQRVPAGAAWASQRRWISERSDGRGRVYEFEDVLSILENPSDSRLLIDVREPREFAQNSIPTAINLPVTSRPDALLLSPDEFQDEFGFQKPPTNKEVVFFCKAGVRSSAAAGIARQAGYTNVGEYKGSWLDWEKRGGPGTKTPNEAGGLGERTGPVTEMKIGGGKTSGEQDLGERGVPQPPKGGQFGTQ